MIYFIRPFLYAFSAAIFFIVFFVLFAPIYIFRFIILITVKYIRQDFGRLLRTRSVIYGVENIHQKPTSTIVVVGIFKQKADTEEIRKNMKELLLGNKKLIELTEYLDYWLGFSFWRKDHHFDISNHVLEHQTNGTFGDKELQDLRSELLWKPFAKKRSPWELLIIHNYRKSDSDSGDTAILMRFHHSLGDGTSLTNFVFQTNQPIDFLKSYSKNQGAFGKIANICRFIFVSPMELFMAHIYGPRDENECHKEEKYLSKKYFNAAISGNQVTVTVNDVKRIKNHFHVGFQSVVYSAVAGSIARSMKQANKCIPDKMKIVTQVPIPGYTGLLENRFGVAILNLPIGEQDAVKRLKLVDQHLEEVCKSGLPYGFFQVIGLLGCLFSCMVKRLANIKNPTVEVTSFPIPAQTFTFFGMHLWDIQIAVGLLSGTIGVGFQIITYRGKFCITATVDKGICADDSMATNLVENFLEELNIYQKKSELLSDLN